MEDGKSERPEVEKRQKVSKSEDGEVGSLKAVDDRIKAAFKSGFCFAEKCAIVSNASPHL